MAGPLRIYRYEVPVDDKFHDFDLHSPPLYVACRQADVVEFWAYHEEGVPPKLHMSMVVVGTGHDVPPDTWHVGSAIWRASGDLVWHLFGSRITDLR